MKIIKKKKKKRKNRISSFLWKIFQIGERSNYQTIFDHLADVRDVWQVTCIYIELYFSVCFFFHNFGEDIKFIESDFYGRFGLTLSELIPTLMSSDKTRLHLWKWPSNEISHIFCYNSVHLKRAPSKPIHMISPYLQRFFIIYTFQCGL